MKHKTFKKQIEEYNELYGMIPDNSEEILSYLEKELKLTEKDFEKIKEMNNYVDKIPWENLKIILPVIPKPSSRPRTGSNGTFYVPGASENKKLFKYYFNEKYSLIHTQIHFSLTTFQPTPMKSMNRWEIYRAEQMKIAAMSNPDFDNLEKTYSDMIQQILILNDNIVTIGHVEKYYSIKPRVEIDLRYQLGYDSKFNKRKMESTKSYRDAIEMGYVTELYTNGGESFW